MLILSSQYIISSPDYTLCPAADRPEYAFIGRSNVGKSSLINMLSNNQQLAKTSNSPGKTQMINHFDVRSATKEGAKPDNWYIVDLPGYGFAKVSQTQRAKWEKMIENYFKKRPNLVNVFVLIDSRHTPQQIDLDFINRMGAWEVPFSLVFTKADKETQLLVSRHVKEFLNRMRETWEFLPPHVVTSAVKKTGREKLLQLIDGMNSEWELRSRQL
ncbi:MAG: YihA family ribosome biogenesis GTP-binding protein [Williamsia sp.]|nr:YihA family ribosome biogenesis GTP-binding protein [Williamsia sp.]